MSDHIFLPTNFILCASAFCTFWSSGRIAAVNKLHLQAIESWPVTWQIKSISQLNRQWSSTNECCGLLCLFKEKAGYEITAVMCVSAWHTRSRDRQTDRQTERKKERKRKCVSPCKFEANWRIFAKYGTTITTTSHINLESFRLLGYHAAWGGSKPSFRDYLSVSSSSVNLTR